jgi:hypothetical protein
VAADEQVADIQLCEPVNATSSFEAAAGIEPAYRALQALA